MPRQSASASSRTRVASVRLDAAEHAALEAKFGTPSRALRALVDEALGQPPTCIICARRADALGTVAIDGTLAPACWQHRGLTLSAAEALEYGG